MLPKHKVESRLRRRIILRAIQSVVLQVGRVGHHIAQIAVAGLHQKPQALAAHPVANQAVDREENRSEDNNE